MNSHQQVALQNHCRFAFETAQPKFTYLVDAGEISIVLTVNSGYE